MTVPAPEPARPVVAAYTGAPIFLPSRPNWPLRAMLIVGALGVIVGTVWAGFGRYALEQQAIDPLSVILSGDFYSRAISDIIAGTLIQIVGGILLITGWAVAANRYRTDSVRIG